MANRRDDINFGIEQATEAPRRRGRRFKSAIFRSRVVSRLQLILERQKNIAARFGENAAKTFRNRKTIGSGGRIFSARMSAKVAASSFVVKATARPGAKGGNFYEALAQWPDLVENNGNLARKEAGAAKR